VEHSLDDRLPHVPLDDPGTAASTSAMSNLAQPDISDGGFLDGFLPLRITSPFGLWLMTDCT